MKIKKCEFCDKDFYAEYNYERYCNSICRTNFHNKKANEAPPKIKKPRSREQFLKCQNALLYKSTRKPWTPDWGKVCRG